MDDLARQVIGILQGRTLSAAESCTGGGVGYALTAVPGSSRVFKGGVVSYCNEIKNALLGVSEDSLQKYGAVSAQVAEEMARGVRKALHSDVGVSVTGLAGPDGDEYGNPVGTVFVGYCDKNRCFSRAYHFSGDRQAVRRDAICAVLAIIVEQNR